MLRKLVLLSFLILILLPFLIVKKPESEKFIFPRQKESYFLVLHRKSNTEYLYKGIAGDTNNSRLLKVFQVKSGIRGVSPTPLHDLMNREYWVITKKEPSFEDPETAPYFLTLDVPTTDEWPYGPVPYAECNGQCDWVIPGYFGLHGVNGDETRLSSENPGSFGCIRHSDSDITYLYNILTPENQEIRYYIRDI